MKLFILKISQGPTGDAKATLQQVLLTISIGQSHTGRKPQRKFHLLLRDLDYLSLSNSRSEDRELIASEKWTFLWEWVGSNNVTKVMTMFQPSTKEPVQDPRGFEVLQSCWIKDELCKCVDYMAKCIFGARW